MALSPEIEPVVDDELEDEQEELLPVSTYKIDFENGRLTNGIITGLEAIKQFIFITLRTPRYVYAIYSSDHGNEIEELLVDEEATIEFKKMELERLIEEALIYDERIDSVSGFNIEHIDDAFHVNFTVETSEGVIDMEEVF